MAKTNITAYDMKEMFATLFYSYEYNIIIEDKTINEKKEVHIDDYLRTDFYTYTLDLRANWDNYDENGNGFNFPNYDEWLKSRGMTSTSYGQVELTGIEVINSEDIDMGSATAKITFVMQIDKADILDKHLAYLRLGIAGKRYQFTNADNEKISFYANIGETTYEAEPFNTPLGKCVIISVTFGISFIQDTFTANQSNIEISLDGSTYEHLYYNQKTDNFIFNGKDNLAFNKPYASGKVNASISYLTTITYWIFVLDNLQLKINEYIKSAVNDTETYSLGVNIPVWIREYIPIFNSGEYTTKAITTKMVITNYQVNIKNSDFESVSLVLSRYGK